MIHSFLLIGQSNAAGRGFKEEVEPIENKRIQVLRNGRWWPMYVPVNPDRKTSGINLIESFADRYANEHNVDVGIIPCADGGTMLDQWCEGSLLFDHACYMTHLAQRTSTVAGVLWHQGESDCGDGLYQHYEEKFLKIVKAFRDTLDLHDVPFLVGGLGDYLVNYAAEDIQKHYTDINEALKRVVAQNERMGFVSAEGLGSNPDNLHFSAKALREFGIRYYEEFLKHENHEKVFAEKKSGGIRTALEHL